VYSLYIDFCMCVYVCYIYLILFISLGYDIMMSHVFCFFFRVQKNFTDYTLGVCVCVCVLLPLEEKPERLGG